MGNYVKRPNKGKIYKTRIIEKTEKTDIDINAIAQAVANALSLSFKTQGNFNTKSDRYNRYDTFDDSKTLEKLAKNMIIQRGDNDSNFENLGNIKEVKRDSKDIKDIDNTIDILSQLKD